MGKKFAHPCTGDEFFTASAAAPVSLSSKNDERSTIDGFLYEKPEACSSQVCKQSLEIICKMTPVDPNGFRR
jgi:hypothetical protein